MDTTTRRPSATAATQPYAGHEYGGGGGFGVGGDGGANPAILGINTTLDFQWLTGRKE